jgi:hypothetical protein
VRDTPKEHFPDNLATKDDSWVNSPPLADFKFQDATATLQRRPTLIASLQGTTVKPKASNWWTYKTWKTAVTLPGEYSTGGFATRDKRQVLTTGKSTKQIHVNDDQDDRL